MKLALFASLLIALSANACKSINPKEEDNSEAKGLKPNVPFSVLLNDGQRDYLEKNAKALHWFRDSPVGNSGIPIIMFKLFPDIFPDIWGDNWEEEVGLFTHYDPSHILPYGLGWNMGSKVLVDLPGLRNIRMQIVNFSCASCHTGRVIDAQGNTQVLLGAPNTKMDSGRWRSKLYQTVNDPRYVFANFQRALLAKKLGWLYQNPLLLGQETLDASLFKSKGEEILAGVKANVSRTYAGIHEFLGVMGYDSKTIQFLDKGALGQLEGGFGAAVSKILPDEYLTLPLGERREKLKSYFPDARMVVDIMSVWRQADRSFAQWDGNIQSKTLRNLGAEVGIIPDSKLVSYENGRITTAFVSELPPPSYPFPIDRTKANQGKEIFDRACASCHGAKTIIVPLNVIGTDPGRSPGITPLAREAISKLILAACRDANNPECKLPASAVIKDMGKGGYVAGPLDGIWARAPYLHNGSVPTLAQLLMPNKRVSKFYRGNIHYDTAEVGFEWRKQDPYTQIYDTSLSGYSNVGHSDIKIFFGGVNFEADTVQLTALLEFLKTL